MIKDIRDTLLRYLGTLMTALGYVLIIVLVAFLIGVVAAPILRFFAWYWGVWS